MKKILGPLLALLLLSQAPSFAQSNLVLVIDQSTQQMDWLDGYTISIPTTLMLHSFDFGNVIAQQWALISSPSLKYSGEGLYQGAFFFFSDDGALVQGITLGGTESTRFAQSFSGTAEGPVAPTFFIGDWSRFASLNPGEYTLDPNPNIHEWSGGIHVMVVPEPATYLFWFIGLGLVVIWRACRPRARACG